MSGKCLICGETAELKFRLEDGFLGWSDLHERDLYEITRWVCSVECLQRATEV